MRIVVVGASGNVGTAVLRRLAAEPSVAEVVGVARRPPTGAGHPYDAARWESVDVGTADATGRLTGVFTGADAVVSLAWRLQPSWDRAALERINVHGTRAVLEMAEVCGLARLGGQLAPLEATSAGLGEAVAHALDELALHRVQANVRTTNEASKRVLVKTGFRREGLALRYLALDGAWVDHDLFAITTEDERGERRT